MHGAAGVQRSMRLARLAAPGALEMVKGCHSKVLMLGHITRTYWPALQVAVRGTHTLGVWVPGPMSQRRRVKHKNHPPPGCYWPPGKHVQLTPTDCEFRLKNHARAHLYSSGAFSKKRIWRKELTSPLSRLTIGCLEGGGWRPKQLPETVLLLAKLPADRERQAHTSFPGHRCLTGSGTQRGGAYAAPPPCCWGRRGSAGA